MSDYIQPSGIVHWVGAGLSNGSGLRIVFERAEHLLLWNRNIHRAHQLLEKLGLLGRAVARSFTIEALHDAIGIGDIVVSMLPAGQHSEILNLCIKRRAHFVCSSYVNDAIRDLVPDAVRSGLVVLAEAGLDPGLDHLLSHELVARAKAALDTRDATVSFRSYCGGIPSIMTDFRYQFSWAPLSVLLALRSPACFIEDYKTRVAARPWDATRPYELDGETFEIYPNRDSTPFVVQYNFPANWRIKNFVRGTLRLAGWHRAWRDVFPVLAADDDAAIVHLAQHLAARYPTTDEHRDRVVLSVELQIVDRDRVKWAGTATVDAIGDANESAMARYVSVPLACGVVEILDGYLTPGLHRAAETSDASTRWLGRLNQWGLRFAVAEQSPPAGEA